MYEPPLFHCFDHEKKTLRPKVHSVLAVIYNFNKKRLFVKFFLLVKRIDYAVISRFCHAVVDSFKY